MSFSERNGIIPTKEIQINSIDEALKNRLWNAIHSFLSDVGRRSYILVVWTDFFKQPRDLLLGYTPLTQIKEVRVHYFAMEWNQVYDLLEFICDDSNWRRPDRKSIQKFIEVCNKMLEQEISGYRIIDDNVIPITSQSELNEIEQALQNPMTIVGNHLKKALGLLSDRKNPDYPNSVKESISSVEAICHKIAGDDKLTLGKALNEMKKLRRLDLHPSMINAISNLYGYSSAVGGARHAMHDDGREISFAEAKFFLVTCSAFVNYLIAKNVDVGG